MADSSQSPATARRHSPFGTSASLGSKDSLSQENLPQGVIPNAQDSLDSFVDARSFTDGDTCPVAGADQRRAVSADRPAGPAGLFSTCLPRSWPDLDARLLGLWPGWLLLGARHVGRSPV